MKVGETDSNCDVTIRYRPRGVLSTHDVISETGRSICDVTIECVPIRNVAINRIHVISPKTNSMIGQYECILHPESDCSLV